MLSLVRPSFGWILLLIGALLTPLSAQEKLPDGALEVDKKLWIVFSLPQELERSRGFRRFFRSPNRVSRLRVTPLLDHPGDSALAQLKALKSVLKNQSNEDPYRFHNPLVAARHDLEKWKSLAFDEPEYDLKEGARPHPLSRETHDALVELNTQLKALQSLKGDNSKRLGKGADSAAIRIKKLIGSEVDQFLLRFIRTLRVDSSGYRLGALKSRQEMIGKQKVLIVSNELPDYLEEIAFVTLDDRPYAFTFAKLPKENTELSPMIKTVLGSVAHTSAKPKLASPPTSLPKKKPFASEYSVKIKKGALLLLGLFLLQGAFKQAGLAWEVCRSRESLSSRETSRTFFTAFWSVLFFAVSVVTLNFLVPSETDLVTYHGFSSSADILSAFGLAILGSLLPTLGARLGCRFSKKGSQWFTTLGLLLAIGILLGSATWFLGRA